MEGKLSAWVFTSCSSCAFWYLFLKQNSCLPMWSDRCQNVQKSLVNRRLTDRCNVVSAKGAWMWRIHSYGRPWYLWILIMEPTSCHLSDAKNSVLVLRCLKNLCTLPCILHAAYVFRYWPIQIHEYVCMRGHYTDYTTGSTIEESGLNSQYGQ